MNATSLRTFPFMSARYGVPNDGIKCKTIVKQSSIPQAGMGRYALEFIPKGTVIFKLKIIAPSNIDALFTPDKMVRLESIEDMFELAINYMDNIKCSFKDVKYVFENYIFGQDTNVIYTATQSGCVNHNTNEKANLVGYAKDGYYYKVATKDIKKGQEIFQDYSTFKYPNFYFDFFKRFKMKPLLMAHDSNNQSKL